MTDEDFVLLLYRALCMIVAAINKRFGTRYHLEKQ